MDSEGGLIVFGDLLPSPEPSPFAIAAAVERREILRRCTDGLSGRQFELLILRYDLDLSFEQIADIFGVSVVAVWRRHERLRTVLRARLAAQNIHSRSEL